jgi:exodeoxyribonuclease VII small subunit
MKKPNRTPDPSNLALPPFAPKMRAHPTMNGTKRDDVAETFPDIAALPFEKAMQELEQIVGKLEAASVPLDESVKLYERGEALKKRCETLLREAEARIEKITLGDNGAPKGVTPLDLA